MSDDFDMSDLLKKLGMTQEEFDAELEEAEDEYEAIRLPKVDIQKARQFQELCVAIKRFQDGCESVQRVVGDFLYPKEEDQTISVKMGQANLLTKESAALLTQCIELADHVQVAAPPTSNSIYFSFTVEDVYRK